MRRTLRGAQLRANRERHHHPRARLLDENGEGGHGGATDNKQRAFMTTLAYEFLWASLAPAAAASRAKL